MRILITNHFPFNGSGTGTYVKDLAEGLQRFGDEVRALVVDSHLGPCDDDPCPTTRITCSTELQNSELFMQFPCFTGHPLSNNTFANLSNEEIKAYSEVARRKLATIVREFVPDIVHCQHLWVHPAMMASLSVPFVVSAQGTDQIGYCQDDRFKQLAQTAAINASKIIAASDFIRGQVIEQHRKQINKIVTVRSSIDYKPYLRNNCLPSKALCDIGVPYCSGYVVAFLGKLVTFKSVDVLLRAAKLYEEVISDSITVICGDGYLRGELERLVEDLQLKRVCFVGNRTREERSCLLAISDVLVVPSRLEPLGLVALEALASGTPVIASSTGGIVELVSDEVGGLFDADDVRGLANQVVKAYAENWKLKKGPRALEVVLSLHCNDQWIKKLRRIYHEVVDYPLEYRRAILPEVW